MSANSMQNRQRVAPTLLWVTLFAGLTSFVYQFMLDGTLLTFMVTLAAIGGLVGSSKGFDERDQQLLWQSYAKAFEYLIAVIFFTYALMLLASGLHIGAEIIQFVNAHWLGTVASLMCVILGVVGVRNFSDAPLMRE